jgi:hypothetical protein
VVGDVARHPPRPKESDPIGGSSLLAGAHAALARAGRVPRNSAKREARGNLKDALEHISTHA